MCEPTFEEWFFSFAAELERLTGQQVNFDRAYDTYLPAHRGWRLWRGLRPHGRWR